MKTMLKNTKENKIFRDILKNMKETDWVGNTCFDIIEDCLISINLDAGKNSGFYIPTPIRLKGVRGIFCVNEDGSLCYDFRIIKLYDNTYKIETLTMSAFNKLERMYCERM